MTVSRRISDTQLVAALLGARPGTLAGNGCVWPLDGRGALELMRAGALLAPEPLHVWLDGRAVPATRVADFTPLATDDSVVAYVSRLREDHNVSEVFIAQYSAQVLSAELWEALLSLLAVLRRHGVTHGVADADFLVGGYRQTPRGIHTDAADTLMFVIDGHKTIALWPSDYFGDDPSRWIGNDSMRTLLSPPTDAVLADATILTGGPGDILHWPSSYWHVGVSQNGDAGAAFNLGLFSLAHDEDAIALALSELRGLATVTADEQSTPHADPATSLPPGQQALLRVIEAASARGVLKRLATSHWMRQQSALGFARVPPLAPVEDVGTSAPVRQRARDIPVVFRRFDDALVVAARGHVTVVGAEHEPLLRALGAGETVWPSAHSAELITWLLRTQAAEYAPGG